MLVLNTRALIQYTVLGLGIMMTVMGLGSVFTHHPYPEFATAGIGAVLASGLVGTVGKHKE